LGFNLSTVFANNLHNVNGNNQRSDCGNDPNTNHKGEINMQTVGENGQSDTEKWGKIGCGIKIEEEGKMKRTNPHRRNGMIQWPRQKGQKPY
jgi:hypothetical protein